MSGELVVICGSRGGFSGVEVTDFIDTLEPDAHVITGGARGVDTFAHDAAVGRGLSTEVYEADWEKYGKRAGYLRNIAMLECNPHRVIAFWDGKSRGTRHTINEARRRDIPVEIFSPHLKEQGET